MDSRVRAGRHYGRIRVCTPACLPDGGDQSSRAPSVAHSSAWTCGWSGGAAVQVFWWLRRSRQQREEEILSIVREVFAKRESMLLFWRGWFGQSRLLKEHVRRHSNIAYVSNTSSARDFLSACLVALHPDLPCKQVSGRTRGANSIALRGKVLTELAKRDGVLSLDQYRPPQK